MRKSILLILFAVVCVIPSMVVASEKEGGILSTENFSSTANFTTDYVFDGVSYSDLDPAVQASFDYYHADTGIYLGLWGSTYAGGAYSNEIEMGVWAGQAGTIGPLSYDVTLSYWFYPGAEDDGFEFDYGTVGINLSHTFEGVPLSPALKVGLVYSPEYAYEDGNYLKILCKLDLALGKGFTLGLEAANIDVEGDKTTGNGNGLDGKNGYEWYYLRAGISKDLIAGFSADLSYYYNSEEEWFEAFFMTDGIADPGLVFSLSRTF